MVSLELSEWRCRQLTVRVVDRAFAFFAGGLVGIRSFVAHVWSIDGRLLRRVCALPTGTWRDTRPHW